MCALTLYHFEMLQFLFLFLAYFEYENKKSIQQKNAHALLYVCEMKEEGGKNSILKVMQ